MFYDEMDFLLGEDTSIKTESVDETIILENLILETGIENFDESEIMALYECGLLSERSIVRLDKNAHRNRAIKKTALQMAKDNNDPLYRKLKWVYRKKKQLIDALTAKYGSRATSKVRTFKFSAKGRVDNTSNRKAAKAINRIMAKDTIKKSKDI